MRLLCVLDAAATGHKCFGFSFAGERSEDQSGATEEGRGVLRGPIYYRRNPGHVMLSQPAGVQRGESMALALVWFITALLGLVHLTPLISLEGKA